MAGRQLKFAEAVNEAIDICMARDPRVFVLGLGTSDPVGVFGTTKGLAQRHGAARVVDMPVAENGMTGVALGAALAGLRPIMTHLRFEFAMLAIDPLVNQAAKWHYMFGGQAIAPMVVRLIVGRGWGQGPQHSQSLHAWFAHVPGLKVVMPATPSDAKGMLIASIEDDAPVVFVEHRWLHGIHGHVPEGYFTTPLTPKLFRRGRDVTIASLSYMTLEAARAAARLTAQGIEAEIIDMRSINPFEADLVVESVARTGRLIVCDHATRTGGFAAEVVTRVTEAAHGALKAAPIRITLPDGPTPTTRALSNYYYPSALHIEAAAMRVLGRPSFDPIAGIGPADLLDVPDGSFKGPF
jgi:pyruvate dehydrogenase E1 component beta subunit